MHVLVTNDDGPPSNQRSWIGKAHFASQIVKPTYFRPGTLHQDDGTTHAKPLHADSGNDSEEWVLVNSTPATATQLGLYHFFQDRGPVDLVVSGPNYGRNTTSLFSLSSGTIGGAMEAAVCRKRAIALSYAFFSRIHDPEIIAGASRMSVKLIEHLMNNWDQGVDLYSVNVPLVEGVERKKVMYTYALQNYWKSGSSFTEIEASGEEDEDPEEKEAEIREQEAQREGGEVVERKTRHKHRHFKWTPKLADVYQSVETSEPGNDGWAVKEGVVSVTPLKANFMHVQGLQGELKLSSNTVLERAKIYVHINYQDSYTHPIILAAISSVLTFEQYTLVDSIDDLPFPQSPYLQITSYESIPFQHLLEYSTTSLACSYVIRKALIRKHYLTHTVHSYIAKHADSGLKDHVPLTIDFEVDYAEFLDEALVEAYELHEAFARNAGRPARDREWWILKPSMSDQGQGIRLFSTESELHDIFQGWEQNQSDPEDEDEGTDDPGDDGEDSEAAEVSKSEMQYREKELGNGVITSQLRHFVAQPYIPPLLLPEYQNRKFHIRTYIACIGAFRVYVYREMLALFAALPYQAPGTQYARFETDGVGVCGEDIDMRPHLTNTCLQNSPIKSVSDSSDPKAVPFLNLSAAILTPSAMNSIYEQIFSTTSHIFRAAAAQPINFQPLPNAFEIYGVDWLVDPDFRVHLLEFNAYPDYAQSGTGGKRLIEGLWRGVMEIVLKGDGKGAKGFFKDLVPDVEEHEAEHWGMKKVLDLDMETERQWPPRSPFEALLSSPSGRSRVRKYQDRTSPSPSPLKKASTTPKLGRMQRKARDHAPLPEDEDDEDEETLQLRLRALEAKLKLKKLQQKKTKVPSNSSDVENEHLDSLSRSSESASRSTAEEKDWMKLEQPARNFKASQPVQVPVSPQRKVTTKEAPKSPGRVLLGIDKGLKGKNVSLRRAPESKSSQVLDDPFLEDALLSRDKGQQSDQLGSRVGKHDSKSRPMTFSEKIADTRQHDKEQKEKARRLQAQRSIGFGINKEELKSLKDAAHEETKATAASIEQTTTRPTFSREEVLKAANKPNGDLVQRSNTASANQTVRRRKDFENPNAPQGFVKPAERPAKARSPSPRLKAKSTSSQKPAPTDASLFEPFSSVHLSKRLIPHDSLTKALSGKSILLLPDVLGTVKAPDYSFPDDLEADCVVLAIIASKSTPLAHKDHDQRPKTAKAPPSSTDVPKSSLSEAAESQANERGKYMALTLTDLKWTLDLYLFDSGFTRWRKLAPGTVIAILNPNIMPPPPHNPHNNRFSLTLNSNDDTILEIGTSRDL
ncbi:MAG: hypothetical protein Q9225_001459, partial [Loekoesia sp. 1 TL-2023]